MKMILMMTTPSHGHPTEPYYDEFDFEDCEDDDGEDEHDVDVDLVGLLLETLLELCKCGVGAVTD